MDNQPLLERYATELEHIDTLRPALVEMPAFVILALISQVQLASRHPENTGPFRDQAVATARQLQQLFNPDSAIAKVLEMGWNPTFDEKSALASSPLSDEPEDSF